MTAFPERGPQRSELDALQDTNADTVWHPYIPRGKLTLLEGDPGQGKSWITLAIATALSVGRGLPGEDETTTPSSILVMTAEDGLGDTVRPRLDSMGADVTRVYACENVEPFDEEGLNLLEKRADDLRPDLIVVDPLVAYIGAGVDIHRANETRAVLARLAEIADQTQSAILAVRHLNKSSGGKAIYRGLGSIDFTAAVRSVLLAYRSDLADFATWVAYTSSEWRSPEVVAAYLRTLEDGGAAYATITRRLTSIHKLVAIAAIAAGRVRRLIWPRQMPGRILGEGVLAAASSCCFQCRVRERVGLVVVPGVGGRAATRSPIHRAREHASASRRCPAPIAAG